MNQPVVVVAQFGVAGNRKQQGQNTRFQELQEMAKKQGAGGDGGGGGGGMEQFGLDGLGDMGDYQKMLADAMKDPAAMDQLKQYGEQFGGVLEQMMQMSPDELQKQLDEAMKLMTDGDLVDTVLSQKEAVLETLEASGTVTPEELARFKADPEYFELKMRESFDQMKDVFANPEYMSKAAEAMQSMKGLMEDPSKISELTKSLGSDWTSDEKIEEARLQFLNGDITGIPGFDEIFQSEEMQEILKDPVKWKATVQDGLEDLLNLGATGAGGGAAAALGAGVGNDEL
jgi:hypothetical protein